MISKTIGYNVSWIDGTPDRPEITAVNIRTNHNGYIEMSRNGSKISFPWEALEEIAEIFDEIGKYSHNHR